MVACTHAAATPRLHHDPVQRLQALHFFTLPHPSFLTSPSQFSLRIVAAPLEIVHFAADPSEPSHGVRLHAPSCSYTGARPAGMLSLVTGHMLLCISMVRMRAFAWQLIHGCTLLLFCAPLQPATS